MPKAHTSLETNQEFLAQKRITMIGISRGERSFSAGLFKELRRRGYDGVPVNPKVEEVMMSPRVTDAIVRDCAETGIIGGGQLL